MGKTSIEWTGFTVNPIRARIKGTTGRAGHYCEKVSPGCKGCYASGLQWRFGMPEFQEQRGMREDIEVFLDPKVLEEVLRRKTPTKFFWEDMSDLFGAWVKDEWIAACFGVMAATPQHTHQMLTKRADRLPQWFEWVEKRGRDGAQLFPDDTQEWRIHQFLNVSARRAGADVPSHHGGEWPLPNVHLGVSAEDQQRANERIPTLLTVPATVRWVSLEPLLGPIDLNAIDATKAGWRAAGPWAAEPTAISAFGKWQERPMRARLQNGIDWGVVGGESGHGARTCDLAWVRSLAKQFRDNSVPVFVKQLGAKPVDGVIPVAVPMETNASGTCAVAGGGAMPKLFRLRHRKGGDPSEWPSDLRVRQLPEVDR